TDLEIKLLISRPVQTGADVHRHLALQRFDVSAQLSRSHQAVNIDPVALLKIVEVAQLNHFVVNATRDFAPINCFESGFGEQRIENLCGHDLVNFSFANVGSLVTLAQILFKISPAFVWALTTDNRRSGECTQPSLWAKRLKDSRSKEICVHP